ncbi:MAG: TRAP transporter large permease [Pseudomonadota bacterium]|nr:TRAP transporter large permease [Pseudomonadota bacterium]
MTIALVAVGLLAAAILTRIPLGFILMAAGIVGIAMIHPRGFDAGLLIAEQQLLEVVTDFQLSVLPLFILMGVFVARAGLADDLFDACYKWLGHLRGGVAIGAVAACAGFAAMSGSTAASAATMSKVAMPALRRFKYDMGFAAGTIAAGGTLGILIPPSGALIVYGLLTETSIADLFMAGLIPGILSALAYIAVAFAVATLRPDWGPRGERFTMREKLVSLSKVWAVAALFLFIIGGIFIGLFTTTEAAGIGAFCAFLIALLRRRMTTRIFFDALVEAAKLSAMIFIMIAGALTLNQFVNFSGLPRMAVEFVTSLNLSPVEALLCILAIYVVLGMFIDGFAMIFLTVPVFTPVIVALGFDPIWWGILLVMVVEFSLITPPVGLNLYIMKSMNPDIPITRIFIGVAPYYVADIARIVLMILVPGLALYLPGLLN